MLDFIVGIVVCVWMSLIIIAIECEESVCVVPIDGVGFQFSVIEIKKDKEQ